MECDMSDQIGRNDQTRTRATETLIKQTKATVVQSITRARPRHGNGCSSTEARSSRSPATYVPAFSPLSPSSHSSLPDNAVDHGHVDPNGQVSEPPLSPKSFISDPPSSPWTKRWIRTSPRSDSILAPITTVTTPAPTSSPPTMRGQLTIQTTCSTQHPMKCPCSPSIASRPHPHPSANSSNHNTPRALGRSEDPMSTTMTRTIPKWARTPPVARDIGPTRKRRSCSTGSWVQTKMNILMHYEQRRTRVSET